MASGDGVIALSNFLSFALFGVELNMSFIERERESDIRKRCVVLYIYLHQVAGNVFESISNQNFAHENSTAHTYM